MSRTVYVLRSLSNPDRHYVGSTSDLVLRLAAHNAGQTKHTAKHRPWKVIVTIDFEQHTTADRFERFLKSGSGRAFARTHF
jgi:putative endonuclease